MTLPAIRIFLIRHGLSEANLDSRVHANKPDFAVELSEEGHRQARAAGEELAQYVRFTMGVPVADQDSGLWQYPVQRRARMLVSPYVRTRQTADGVAEALGKAGIAFDRRESEELREISFGIFDGLTDEEIRDIHPREHHHYEKHRNMSGEMFAPMPLGESRIQVGDRVKQMFGTILRDAEGSADREPILDFFVVAHGISIIQFRQRWLHHPWEWAESMATPANCSITMIEGRSGQRMGPEGQTYVEEDIFEGFRHERHSAQDEREEGHV